MQGRRFEYQKALWSQARIHEISENPEDESEIWDKFDAKGFLEDEAESLESRYRPEADSDSGGVMLDSQGFGHGDNDRLKQIMDRCRDVGGVRFDNATLHEEQERELSPEEEQERQVEKAPPAQPAQHNLHPHVVDFTLGGHIPTNSPAFMPAFTIETA